MHLRFARILVNILDNRFKVLGFRFGIDPILGLIPGIGDIIPFVVSFYLIFVAHLYNLPRTSIDQMIKNTALDMVIGSIPILGDIYDFAFRAYSKNLAIIEGHLADRQNIIEGHVVSKGR